MYNPTLRYYPTSKRLIRYCESAVVTGAMLIVALVFMIFSLNLQVCVAYCLHAASFQQRAECSRFIHILLRRYMTEALVYRYMLHKQPQGLHAEGLPFFHCETIFSPPLPA